MHEYLDAAEGGIYTPVWDVLKSTAMRVHVVFLPALRCSNQN